MLKALVFAAVLGSLALFSPGKAAAEAPDFSICDGLTGAAWGLCRAGVAAGCADGTGGTTPCTRIEDMFFDVAGVDAPWIAPPAACPCDYAAYVPLTAATWSVAGVPKNLAFNCPGDEAFFVAVSPLPQLPQVTAIRTTAGDPVCQAVPQGSGAGFVSDTTEDEHVVCRRDVISYGTAFKTLFPTHPLTDLCSPTLP